MSTAVRRPGLRFVAEAAVIVLAAVVAGVLDAGAWGIIAAVAVVWVSVSIFEFAVSHPRSRRERARRRAGGTVVEDTVVEDTVVESVERGEPDAEPEPEPDAEPEPERDAATEPLAVAGADPVPVGDEEPEPAAEQETDVEPAREPQPQAAAETAEPAAEPEAAAETAEPAAEPEPEREPEPQLEAEPAPEAEPEPEPEPEPQAVPEPRRWNIWELERAFRGNGGADEERELLLLYLRDYAGPDGMLPVEFDGLVRESFGDLLEPSGA